MMAAPTAPPPRPSRLADASFMGKFERMSAEYAALPSIDDDLGDEEAGAAVADWEVPMDRLNSASILDPRAATSRGGLAELAERTRSQLLLQRPSQSDIQEGSASTVATATCSAVTVVAASCSTCCSACGPIDEGPEGTSTAAAAAEAEASPPSGAEGSGGAMRKQTSQRPAATTARHGSMITHASRTTGAATHGPGHTFGALARTSASGTMPHHAPTAMPTAAAVARLARPSSARGVAGTPLPRQTEGKERSAAPAVRPSSARSSSGSSVGSHREGASRPGSARGGSSNGDGVGSGGSAAAAAAPRGYEPPPFGANARGAVSYRHPAQQHHARPPKQPRAFKFVECCGEPFEEYCCRRHHPDDAIVCCEKHDPAHSLRLAKSAMGGRVGAGKGPAFSLGKGPPRCTAIGEVPR